MKPCGWALSNLTSVLIRRGLGQRHTDTGKTATCKPKRPGEKSGLCVLSHPVVSDSLQPYGLQPARLLCLCGVSRQESWSGLLCPPPGDLPNPEIKPRSPAMEADSLPLAPTGKPKIKLADTLISDSQPPEL